MPVNPDIIFILLYFKKKVYRQSVSRRFCGGSFFVLEVDNAPLIC